MGAVLNMVKQGTLEGEPGPALRNRRKSRRTETGSELHINQKMERVRIDKLDAKLKAKLSEAEKLKEARRKLEKESAKRIRGSPSAFIRPEQKSTSQKETRIRSAVDLKENLS